MDQLKNSKRNRQNELTGWVPVFGDPPQAAPTTSTATNTLGPILGMVGCFTLILFAIAWSMGLMESPNQEKELANQNLEQQLTSTEAELAAIKQCIAGGE